MLCPLGPEPTSLLGVWLSNVPWCVFFLSFIDFIEDGIGYSCLKNIWAGYYGKGQEEVLAAQMQNSDGFLYKGEDH